MSFDLLDSYSRPYRYIRHLGRHVNKQCHKTVSRQPVIGGKKEAGFRLYVQRLNGDTIARRSRGE
jgi:hypothetical protein